MSRCDNNTSTNSMDSLINYADDSQPEPVQIQDAPQPGDCIYCADDNCDGLSCTPPREQDLRRTTTTGYMDANLHYLDNPQPVQTLDEPQPGDCIYCADDHCDGVSCTPPREQDPHRTATTSNHSVNREVDNNQSTQCRDECEEIDVPALMKVNEALRAQVEWLWKEHIDMSKEYREDAGNAERKTEDLEQNNEMLLGLIEQDEKNIDKLEEENRALKGLKTFERHLRDEFEKDIDNLNKRIAVLEKDKEMVNLASESEHEIRKEISRLKAFERYMRDEYEKNEDNLNKKIKALEMDKKMVNLASESELEILKSEISRLQKQIEDQNQNSAACVSNARDNIAHITNLQTTLTYQTAEITRLKEELEAEKLSKHEAEKQAGFYQEELELRETADHEQTAEMESIIEDFEIKTLRHQDAIEARDRIIRLLRCMVAIFVMKLKDLRRETAESSTAVSKVFQDQQRQLQELEQKEERRRMEKADQKRRLEQLEQLNEILAAQLQSAKVPLEKSMSLMHKLEAQSECPYKSDREADADEEDNAEDLSAGPEGIRREENSDQQHIRFSEEMEDDGHSNDEDGTLEPSEPEYVIVDGRNELRAWNGRARRGSSLLKRTVDWDEESWS
ncbi:hypothetical protein F5882DRAFT_506510 [Hyaloscypha sp. PMI_1271]|nr:hypothetical protein F5882DRAFT_506510 [Hyaloscypha sp. PMI_1271]